MISIHKVQIYDRCGGDIQGLYRGNQQVYQDDITENEWGLIAAFQQDIHLVNNHLASKKYAEKFMEQLKRSCTDNCYTYFLEKNPHLLKD